jgi:DNA gyrase subunit A
VLLRGTRFDLNKAEERLHIVEGLLIALANIDEVVRTIRESKDTDTRASALMAQVHPLVKRQADAILEMRLRTLTALEVHKLEDREARNCARPSLTSNPSSPPSKKQYEVIKQGPP